MSARLEEALYVLLWSAEMLLRPTFRNLTESYEDWAYRTGLGNHLARLNRKKLVEAARGKSDDVIIKLTERGRLQALGGRDPAGRWAHPWDGWWRLAVFDVPVEQRARRQQLQRWLRKRRYGCLQGSVWVTPDFGDDTDIIDATANRVQAFVFMKAKPYHLNSGAEIVSAAWNFARLNQLYDNYLKILKIRPASRPGHMLATGALELWAAREREAWRAALDADPLLPRCLHPPGYLGPEAYRQRREALGVAGRRLLEV